MAIPGRKWWWNYLDEVLTIRSEEGPLTVQRKTFGFGARAPSTPGKRPLTWSSVASQASRKLTLDLLSNLKHRPCRPQAKKTKFGCMGIFSRL
jgi:hypothetical protein